MKGLMILTALMLTFSTGITKLGDQEPTVIITPQTDFTGKEIQANLELERLLRTHPDLKVRTFLYWWIQEGIIPIAFQYDVVINRTFFDHTIGVLYLDPDSLLYSDEKVKILDFKHVYVHADWYINKPLKSRILKDNPPQEKNLKEFAQVTWELECEAFWEEVSLALEMGADGYYPELLCWAAKKGNKGIFQKQLYDLLIQNAKNEKEKILHPFWKELISKTTE